MLRLNIAWKYALNVPVGYEGFDDSLLTHFRARLIVNNKEKVVFKKTLELAKEAKEGIGRSLAFYNQERRHQSLDYRTPTEVYFNMRNQKTTSIGILKYNQLVFDQ